MRPAKRKMAAKSGGTDEWTSSIKTLLGETSTSLTKNGTVELAQHIVKSEQRFNVQDGKQKTFYVAICTLAADYIASFANSYSKSQLPVVCHACRIILEYLVNQLVNQVQSEPGSSSSTTVKQLLVPIRALCTGQSLLTNTEEAALMAIVHNTNGKDNEADTLDEYKKEAKRPHTDLSSNILQRLTVPLQEFGQPMPFIAESTSESTSKATNDTTNNEIHTDTKTIFVANNIGNLHSLGAGEVLLDMCCDLPHLSRYAKKYQAYLNKKGFGLPANTSDAHAIRHSLHSLVNDINIVHNTLSLPIHEPLTSKKLEKLSTLAMSCLYCSIANAVASSIVGISNAVSPKCSTNTAGGTPANQSTKNTEEEYDALAITVVEKSIEIFGQVSNLIKNSTRAGGHILQNHLMIGVWLLVNGLQAQLSTSSFSATDKGKEEKGKSPSKARDGTARINLMKVQQGFSVLSVALASHALVLMSALLEDLAIDTETNSETVPARDAAPLNILSTSTALARAITFMRAVPLNHLLFYLATISYRKACTLKRIQKNPMEGDALSQSDSTTYYDDLLSCSENSTDEEQTVMSVEDDSEPILGLWFEETLAPSDGPTATSNEASAEHTASIVPEKCEPYGYISLATKIFQFMNKHLIGSRNSFLRDYVAEGLVEQQMVILAALIRDLDHETARTETGTISVSYGATLGTLYSEFSRALCCFTHNLLTHGILTEDLQNTLLQHLGVNPWSVETTTPWPLQVYPRTLSVLIQIILIKSQAEKEAACINIWHRLVTTLVENVCNPPATFETENEDLNVEHAQLLLFLFHCLNLMQKKSVLLLTGSGAVRCSEAVKTAMNDRQLLQLSRLLLLLEYLMEHLYDAPPTLLEQIQWNLFSATSLVPDTKDGNKQAARIFIPWVEIEDNYRKFTSHDEFAMKPRFYNLSTADFNNQETPKLDGLACSFILGTPDKMKYPLLVDALIDILNVLAQTDMPRKVSDGKDKITFTGLCAIEYCFSICWRLLLMLPPSAPYMDKLALGEEIPAGPMLLHSLIWGPRTAYNTFTEWMKDCLVKQGIYTQYAENLIKTVSSTVNSLKYDVTLAKNCITSLKPEVPADGKIMAKTSLPKLQSLCILAAIVGKLQVLFDESLTRNSADNIEACKCTDINKAIVEVLPHMLSLTKAMLLSCRSSILYQMLDSTEVPNKYSSQDYGIIDSVISVAGANWAIEANLVTHLPNSVRSALDKWKLIVLSHVPWNIYANDIIPAESYILTTVHHHISPLSEYPTFSINPSLKNLLHSLIAFMAEYVTSTTAPEQSEVHAQAVDILISISMDARMEYLQELSGKVLTKLLGEGENENRQLREHLFVLNHTYNLIIDYTSTSDEAVNVIIDEKILKRCIKYWEDLLEKAVGRKALNMFFAPNTNHSLVNVLLSVTSPRVSQQFSIHVLHFFNALFKATEKLHYDTLVRLCSSILNLANIESEKLQAWLRHVILGGVSGTSPSASSTNVQTPTVVTANSLVAPSSSTEEGQKVEDANNASNSEQVQWAILLSDGSVGSNQASNVNDDHQLLHENTRFLRAFTNYIAREKSSGIEDVAVTILQALIPLGYHILSPTLEASGFAELMHVMSTLADAGAVRGLIMLLKATTEWIEFCKQQLMNKDSQSLDKSSAYVEGGCCMLNYIAEIASAVRSQQQNLDRAVSPPWEGITPINESNDIDWMDDITQEEEDSAAEDSDEDSLCNKLCTFTISQKEFISQHWYNCYTCNLVDGIGVCTVCARVCHRGHDVTYSKCGNFFCDCGARDDGSCQALTKRSPQASEHQASNNGPSMSGASPENNTLLPSSLRQKTSSPVHFYDKHERVGRDKQKQERLAKMLEGSKEWVQSYLWRSGLVASLMELIHALIPAVDACCQRNSPVGSHARAQKALEDVHSLGERFEYTDQLMLPTLGSQEGAFENVRMNFAGEQGQTIKQLISAHLIRRVVMCCMSSSHGKRQHLAVANEKGRITVLQLSALLKQADSSKRKLTLTKVGATPIPFMALSITGNQWNEDCLAVCGYKDCHVLTFHSTGIVCDHIVLHSQLETGNYIIKALWLPGSPTKLALVTADFIKIFDLSKDASSPQYHFLLPTGKIRDCTFMHVEGDVFHILIMSSAGYIYAQTTDTESLAKDGPFYVTDPIEIYHPDLEDDGQMGNGGVSIYYSHTLQLLFFSFVCGKNFFAPLKDLNPDSVIDAIQIHLASNKSNGNKSNNNQPQPLCQWSEIDNHPGLVCAVLQASNNPMILMIKPDTILIQEIKVLPAKAKIIDMVGIRHLSSNSEYRTTLIVLCEDGSLRIYMAGMEQTGFWMSPAIQPTCMMAGIKQTRKKKTNKSGKPTGSVTFPIDFFEHCEVINDIEFGGNDLLQIYNVQQLKNRINTTGMYIVSTKATGFNVEVINNDPLLVMTGVRVLLGCQDVQRAPLYVEVFGRSVRTTLTKSRWFDIPLTKEESLQADKKLTITFGPSQDPEGVIIVDAIKIYGKTKDAFGWPEETEEILPAGQSAAAHMPAVSNETDSTILSSTPLLSMERLTKDNSVNTERMVASILEVLELSFSLSTSDDNRSALTAAAIDVGSRLLTLPTPPLVQVNTTELLATLYSSAQIYHLHKDQVLLSHVLETLKSMREIPNPCNIDAENFCRLVLIVRGIAINRPQNLAKFADQYTNKPVDESQIAIFEAERSSTKDCTSVDSSQHLVLQLMEVLWKLHTVYPKNMAVAPVVVPGLRHTEAIVQALVEIIHAFTVCDVESNTSLAAKVYMQLLLSSDSSISFNAKQAIIRVLGPRYKRRRVQISNPSNCNTPAESEEQQATTSQPVASTSQTASRSAAPSAQSTSQQSTLTTSQAAVASTSQAVPSTSTSQAATSTSQAVPSTSQAVPSTSGSQATSQAASHTNSQAASQPVPSPSTSQSSQEAAEEALIEAAIELEQKYTFESTEQSSELFSGSEANRAPSDGRSNPLEAVLVPRNFPHLLDIPSDADDEAMVELAIALSLQDHEGAVPNLQSLQNFSGSALQSLHALAAQGIVQGPSTAQGHEGHYSDTTASAAASDDEGSTAATDGSTLRTSPADQGGSRGSKGSESGGSESGGSAVDSMAGEHNVSGRSSAYDDNATADTIAPVGLTVNQTTRTESSSLGVTTSVAGTEQEGTDQGNEQESDTAKLHAVRLVLLNKLMQFVPDLTNVSGVLVIPYMQVILMLASDLDGQDERDRTCLERLLYILVRELEMDKPGTTNICEHTNKREVHLIIMRLLSVLMSRSKCTTKSTSESPNFISQAAATMLNKAGVMNYCLTLLKALLDYWKSTSTEETGSAANRSLLKERLTTPPPDMSPFFLRQYVKGHAGDVFEPYPQLLTEMVLRLPYQVHKYTENENVEAAFEQSWYYYLCEYMMLSQTPFIRRQVRKLLLFICGNKEKYRQLRDMHALVSHMQAVEQCCSNAGYSSQKTNAQPINLPYDSLVELIEHLKACVEIASSRTGNWQRFCLQQNNALPYLLSVSILLDEGVSPTVLQLLQYAICLNNKTKEAKDTKGKDTKTSGSTSKERRERDKSDDIDTDTEAKFEESQCVALVEQIQRQVSPALLTRFIRTFLLETNNTNVRWQAHSLIAAIYKNCGTSEQERILDILWSLWPQLPLYGRKAAQFVDLLGYFTLKTPHSANKLATYMRTALKLLRTQNRMILSHPNAHFYTYASQYVQVDGYYLESEPCLVCNNPEVPFSTIKLSSIKVDSKFTTSTQIVKLISSHTISRITLRIGDLKRTKLVRTINVYYNNRSVQAVVELKNKSTVWHKAKQISLSHGQTEVKIEFPLPIIACNLMIEYADFYENIQASTENLQCPRCSASVPANPGVCANCGENVFQCHKCRAINYDEKDPFLCHSCGYCKYAKFDYTLTARPCCAVDPIENDDDRAKAVSTINNLLEKADRIYKILSSQKSTLQMLLSAITASRTEKLEENAQSANNPQINQAIQLLAQKYCVDCKNSFEDLSKIIQKVLACRRELVTYDVNQRGQSCSTDVHCSSRTLSLMSDDSPTRPARCYGCALAATEYCLMLLRALATNSTAGDILCKIGLVQELLEYNLRKGRAQMQEDVRHLLCSLTKDNTQHTSMLCQFLIEDVSTTLRGLSVTSDMSAAVRHEMALLSALVQKHDSCWEQKVRCVMQLFLVGCEESGKPVVMECIVLPCLKILQSLTKPDSPISKKNKDKTIETIASVQPPDGRATINVAKWITGDSKFAYDEWFRMAAPRRTHPKAKKMRRDEAYKYALMERFVSKWRERCIKDPVIQELKLVDSAWLKVLLFNSSSREVRQVVCNLVESICLGTERRKKTLLLLTCYFDEVRLAGENSAEFFALYQNLIRPAPWKEFLATRGTLVLLASLITKEIEELHRLEEMTLTTDLTQGYALKMFTELLATFLEQENIKRVYKGRLVGSVLNGYLSLRKLVVQRTRLIDETQEKLLELLEEITTGTEREIKAFMAICIETVQKYNPQDFLTPVFIFERLCSIIYPEDNDVGEFFLTLEKDPQQEDFLQGRMLGNPYSSLEPGLGPLMRDVKNKICQDCELVALLEDDNGMELLVNNKIISLDLQVKEVYKKIWLAEGGESDAMRVVYRMRGLLGDATEEFVETLNVSNEQVNDEEVYKMANVLADCGGLQVMLERLAAIQDVTRAKPLLQVLIKLFKLCVKVKKNRDVLSKPELGAITILLDVLQRCLASESDSSQAKLTEQLLDIMETILANAASQSLSEFEAFSRSLSSPEHVKALLSCTQTAAVKQGSSMLAHLTRVLAALTYSDRAKMELLYDYFKPVLNFYKFDFEHTPEDEQKLELFCVLTEGIERNAIGNTLKDYMIDMGIVRDAFEYISAQAPCVTPALLCTDSDELKDFISKPALKFILRFLAGLATDHEPTQLAASQVTINIIHRLEQVSSDEHVGSLAENLLEALCTNVMVAPLIEEARQQTRMEKKRLAMAMRERQLGALGMQTNDKGQVTASGSILQQMEDLGDETGLVCVICREGYKFKPNMVLGIYTFTKRCNVEEFEIKQRKTVGYTTVTHFNVVHVDCHMSAVRLARGRDEWESAALQNANTKCNGLLPLWGPQVPESAFASCLARHNTYLQECTSHRDISYPSTIHDLKLLLLRFAQEKSFHEDSGGGGAQSNMHMVPYLIHMALYVINTTRAATREDKALVNYLENSPNASWLENCYEADGPFYQCTLSLMLLTPSRWNKYKSTFFNRFIILAHQRYISPSAVAKNIVDTTMKEYSIYKSALVFLGLIDSIYSNFFGKINVLLCDEQWPLALAEYIRHNDEAMLKASERVLAAYRDELLPCASFEEFCDVTGLLGEISDPSAHVNELLRSLA